jgi:hypothetical protein
VDVAIRVKNLYFRLIKEDDGFIRRWEDEESRVRVNESHGASDTLMQTLVGNVGVRVRVKEAFDGGAEARPRETSNFRKFE